MERSNVDGSSFIYDPSLQSSRSPKDSGAPPSKPAQLQFDFSNVVSQALQTSTTAASTQGIKVGDENQYSLLDVHGWETFTVNISGEEPILEDLNINDDQGEEIINGHNEVNESALDRRMSTLIGRRKTKEGKDEYVIFGDETNPAVAKLKQKFDQKEDIKMRKKDGTTGTVSTANTSFRNATLEEKAAMRKLIIINAFAQKALKMKEKMQQTHENSNDINPVLQRRQAKKEARICVDNFKRKSFFYFSTNQQELPQVRIEEHAKAKKAFLESLREIDKTTAIINENIKSENLTAANSKFLVNKSEEKSRDVKKISLKDADKVGKEAPISFVRTYNTTEKVNGVSKKVMKLIREFSMKAAEVLKLMA